MNFFDNHCDTLDYLLGHGENLHHASGQVSLKKAAAIQQWAQVFALFIDDTKGPQTPYERYCALREIAHTQLARYPTKLLHCRTGDDLDAAFSTGRCGVILSVENGAMLEGRMDRLGRLQQDGIKLLTLTWYGENEIGFASKVGGRLKPFGRAVAQGLGQYGIVPDISHLSDEGAEDLFALHTGAVVASHSNARSITPHFRNLAQWQIAEIVRRKGLVGLNLFLPFLKVEGLDALEQIHAHINYFLQQGAEDCLCFGTDFDGVGADLPQEIAHIGGMPVLLKFLRERGLSKALLEKIFFENANRFWHAHLG